MITKHDVLAAFARAGIKHNLSDSAIQDIVNEANQKGCSVEETDSFNLYLTTLRSFSQRNKKGNSNVISRAPKPK